MRQRCKNANSRMRSGVMNIESGQLDCPEKEERNAALIRQDWTDREGSARVRTLPSRV